MEPGEYLDARWHALVRAAVDLGATEEDAPAIVQQVLARNERRIRRAADPDPLVHDALAVAIRGSEPAPGPRRWPAMAAATAILVGVGTAIAVTRPEGPPADRLRADQVPSLFGYDATAARELLEGRGFEVTLEPFRDCEVMDRVVASDPPPGTTYDEGDPITVYTSLPADVTCLTDYQDRATAWQLLDFANGRGPAPPFADRVFVYPGDGPATVLTRDRSGRPEDWAETGVLDAVREASARVALVDEHPPTYALPAIRVIAADDDLGRCGVPEPTVAGTDDVFSVLVRSPERTGCPLRLDIYRTDGEIDGVVLYPPSP